MAAPCTAQDDNWLYMSAVCYIFGREIQAHTGKPLGLVNTNWGGTPVEFWMSDEAEANCASQRKPSPAGGAYNGMVSQSGRSRAFPAATFRSVPTLRSEVSVCCKFVPCVLI
jgi:hypothetical protein